MNNWEMKNTDNFAGDSEVSDYDCFIMMSEEETEDKAKTETEGGEPAVEAASRGGL